MPDAPGAADVFWKFRLPAPALTQTLMPPGPRCCADVSICPWIAAVRASPSCTALSASKEISLGAVSRL
ncbi:MAG: hypothetical protein P4L71_10590 [Acetobacteraceae bacterium]|nr:hypothetical protein [Acetobacteraceae bacterium]